MNLFWILFLAIVPAVTASLITYRVMKPKPAPRPTGPKPDFKEEGSVDKELTDPGSDLENIPEEDQEYIGQILSKLVQEYIPIKVRYATNAMLIEHLGVALGKAAASFEKRRVASDDHQELNEDWLKVASWALRLYREGTPHNSPDTLDRFTMISTLSERELSKYATATMNQAGGKIRKIMDGEEEESGIKREKAPQVGNKLNPYTASEIEDLKNAQDKRMNQGGDR